jgi:hypothetical protein
MATLDVRAWYERAWPTTSGLGYERACLLTSPVGRPGLRKQGRSGLVTGVPLGGIMPTHSSSAMMVSPAREPEQLPISPRLDLAESSTANQGDGRLRPLEVAQCSLCGIALPLGLLVPDGGPACADVRWYCKEAKSCTERWTAARPLTRAYIPATPGHVFAGAGESPAAGAAVERPVGLPEQAQSFT